MRKMMNDIMRYETAVLKRFHQSDYMIHRILDMRNAKPHTIENNPYNIMISYFDV